MSKPKQILKISNSFHVFNFTPTSPKPNTIVGSREEQFIQGGFVRTRDASGCLENSTYIYSYYSSHSSNQALLSHTTSDLVTAHIKAFSPDSVILSDKGTHL